MIAQTPPYDHCNMTVDGRRLGRGSTGSSSCCSAWTTPTREVRPLLDLEGLTRWLPGRTSGYAQLEAAVDHFGFYDATGQVTADGYRP